MRSRRPLLIILAVALAGIVVPRDANAQGAATRAPAPARTLDIYIADTEGGKAALYVAPSGETVLIDTRESRRARRRPHHGDARRPPG